MTENQICSAPLRADLKAFADGELSPLARFRVARHLRLCPSCQQELIQMQTLSSELEASEGQAEPLAPELRAHILDSVPISEQIVDEEAQKRQRRVARKKMVLALGTCSIAGAFLFVALNNATSIKSTYGTAANVRDAPSAASLPSQNHDVNVIVGGASNGVFADGHVKSQNGPLDSVAADRASAKSSAAQNAVSSSGASPVVDLRNGNENIVVPGALAQRRAGSGLDSVAGDYKDADQLSVLPPSRVVHREGSLSVAVANAETASENATVIIKNAGGFVANTSLETGANQKRTATLDCRVPVAQFEIVVSKIGALGKVRAKSLSGQDITAQVARSGARRQTLSQELSIAQARLEQREKSRKKADTYELRAEVRTLRIQASQARAGLEALQKYGSLSSLYVSLQDTSPAPTPKVTGWVDSLSPSSRGAWDAFLSNARIPLQLVLWILAYSPLWLPLLLVWHKFGRKWLIE